MMLDKVKIEQQIQLQGDLVRQLKAAKESKEKNVNLQDLIQKTFRDLSLKIFDEYLSSRSYLWGYTPTNVDLDYYELIRKRNFDLISYVHICRWYKHIKSFAENENDEFSRIDLDGMVNMIKSLLEYQV